MLFIPIFILKITFCVILFIDSRLLYYLDSASVLKRLYCAVNMLTHQVLNESPHQSSLSESGVCMCARACLHIYFFPSVEQIWKSIVFPFLIFSVSALCLIANCSFSRHVLFFFLREKDLSACVFCFLSWGDWYDRCSWKRPPSSRPHTSCQGCPSLPLFVTCAKVGACRLPCRPDTWSFDT